MDAPAPPNPTSPLMPSVVSLYSFSSSFNSAHRIFPPPPSLLVLLFHLLLLLLFHLLLLLSWKNNSNFARCLQMSADSRQKLTDANIGRSNWRLLVSR